MKLYRVLGFFDFDNRVWSLRDPIQDKWDEADEPMRRASREQTIGRLRAEFGEHDIEGKVQNFIDLEAKPMSILAFHNAFFAQARAAFVMGAYYPALTGACALGERILNHLLLTLREHHKTTPEYKHVYRKDSFDDWALAIDTLESWQVLLPGAVTNFRLLAQQRNRALHFRPETDTNVRALALDAVTCLQRIIAEQFGGFGLQPWFMNEVPGEVYIKSEWEGRPFIQHVYLPNSILVGPRHRIESMIPQIAVNDPDLDAARGDCIDSEYATIRREFNACVRPT